MPYEDRPVFVVPDHPLTRQDIAGIARFHYEGTSLDQTQHYAAMSPHAQTDRPICYSTTDYSAVWQLRAWMPDAIGGVMWLAMSRPCSSAYVPYYGGISSVPTECHHQDRLQRLQGRRRQSRRHRHRRRHDPLQVLQPAGALLRTAPSSRTAPQRRRASRATAAGLTGAARITYLTNYTAQRATQAYSLALSLPAQMP